MIAGALHYSPESGRRGAVPHCGNDSDNPPLLTKDHGRVECPECIELLNDWSEPSELIPEISTERMLELHKKMRPLARFNILSNGKANPHNHHSLGYLFSIRAPRAPGLRSVSFLWKPLPIGETRRDLVPCQRVLTYHTCASRDLFRPTVGEVLACIDYEVPRDLLGRVVAYETHADTDKRNLCADGRHHWTVTVLYRKRVL